MREFAEMIATEIRNNTELEAQVTTKGMADGTERYGVAIRAKGEKVAPTIYVENFRDLNVEQAAKEIIKLYEDNRVADIEVDWFTDFEQVKARLFVRLLPKTFSTDVFRSAKAYGFDDLILVPYVNADMVGIKGSIKITRDHIEKWGVTKRTVLDIAISNTKKAEVSVQSMSAFMTEITGDDYGLPAGPMIVSNKEKCYGASAIIGKINDLKKRNPGGFFVLPSSIHEVLVLPKEDGMEKEYFDAMVREVNVTSVLPEEVLADHAYAF